LLFLKTNIKDFISLEKLTIPDKTWQENASILEFLTSIVK